MSTINMTVPKVKKSFYSLIIKRALDIVISGVAILGLSPIFLLLIVLELVYHGKPIFFVQQRPGLKGKIFNIYKFRSMTNETDENGNLLPGEQRVTNFGRILRRLSLDELPELFCIFIGKMSIIGPRPLLPEYLPYYSNRHKMRHAVRPGLACVSLKASKSWTWNDQFENDIWYVENISFLIDSKMIFAVAKEVFSGSEYRVNDTREKFTRDYWKNK